MSAKGILLIAVLIGLSACDFKEDGKTVVNTDSLKKEIKVDTGALSKAWDDYMTPGVPHALLASTEGEWQAVLAVYPAGVKKPIVYDLTCKNSMILDGRFLQSIYKGVLGTVPFESISTVGYDNNRKIYTSTWMDSMSTGIINLEGTMDPGGKKLTLLGTTKEVLTGNDIGVRQVIRFITDNTMSLEMFDTRAGIEEKTLSLAMKRK